MTFLICKRLKYHILFSLDITEQNEVNLNNANHFADNQDLYSFSQENAMIDSP